MSEQQKGTSYGSIFKTTFLFGFVQVFNIIVKVGINKVVALLLGPNGMGIIGLYNTAIGTIKTGAGLGVSQSAVRDISEANAGKDYHRFSRIISLTNRVIIFTSLLGVVLTIVLSPVLSQWQFGNHNHTIAFVWLSVVVGLNILSEGQLAILKGMRQLRSLAKASMIGSLVGLLSAIPFYYFFGEGGIVPSLLVTAFAALFFSNFYVRRIKYDRIKIKLKELFKEASPMVKMGVALMMVGFIGSMFDLIVASYISRSGSLSDVGLYNAGSTIITGYFGVVITAMSTDYYPRISAVHADNSMLKMEMDKQSESGLVMIFPLVVLFVFLSRFFIRILYSEEFEVSNQYTDYAMIGTILTVVSNCMGMILLAKQAANIFVISVLCQRTLLVGVYLLLYNYFGLLGLGWAYICTGVVHLTFMSFILLHFYKIKLGTHIYKLLLLIISVTIITILVRKIEMVWLKYTLGVLLFTSATLFSYIYMKKHMDIDLFAFLNTKFFKK